MLTCQITTLILIDSLAEERSCDASSNYGETAAEYDVQHCLPRPRDLQASNYEHRQNHGIDICADREDAIEEVREFSRCAVVLAGPLPVHRKPRSVDGLASENEDEEECEESKDDDSDAGVDRVVEHCVAAAIEQAEEEEQHADLGQAHAEQKHHRCCPADET